MLVLHVVLCYQKLSVKVAFYLHLCATFAMFLSIKCNFAHKLIR